MNPPEVVWSLEMGTGAEAHEAAAETIPTSSDADAGAAPTPTPTPTTAPPLMGPPELTSSILLSAAAADAADPVDVDAAEPTPPLPAAPFDADVPAPQPNPCQPCQPKYEYNVFFTFKINNA